MEKETNIRMRPTYTTILHERREKLGLSVLEYCIADTVYKLSRPICYLSRTKMAKLFGITKMGTIKAIDRLVEKGIIEKNEEGHLTTTQKWYTEVEAYEEQFGKQSLPDGAKSLPSGKQSLPVGKQSAPNINNYNNNYNNTSATRTNVRSRCPLENENSTLKSEYPKGHKECTEYIDSVAQTDKNHKFVNYSKQIGCLHRILKAGYSFKEIDVVIEKIKKDNFYREKGWDFATVASFIDRK